MLEETLQTLLEDRWIYRGEGNANLALCLPNRHQVLKIPKSDVLSVPTSDGSENSSLDFYNCLMIPLLGKSYSSPATKVITEKEEIMKLDQELLPMRPEIRKTKRLKHGLATLWDDCAFLPKIMGSSPNPTFAVELKPKQGWCFPPDILYKKCQFCINQYLKLQSGQITQISSYCPMNFFSGEKVRMVSALKGLIENPQNNFRIFQDGVLIFDKDSVHGRFETFLSDYFTKSLDEFCDLMYEALTKRFDLAKPCPQCRQSCPQTEDLPNGHCYFQKSTLPPGCVLRKLLDVQQLYAMKLREVHGLYRKLKERNAGEWDYLEKVLVMVDSTACPKCFLASLAKQEDLGVVPYLIAAVVNDCSLMVTFRRAQDDRDMNRLDASGKFNQINGKRYSVSLGIFDLQPKCLSTIEKHVKRNDRVESAFKSYTGR